MPSRLARDGREWPLIGMTAPTRVHRAQRNRPAKQSRIQEESLDCFVAKASRKDGYCLHRNSHSRDAIQVWPARYIVWEIARLVGIDGFSVIVRRYPTRSAAARWR